jgi:exopolysaccharide biosynthesis polyprenyl glycosylphosphotransferase
VNNQRLRTLFSVLLFLLDLVAIAAAFVLAWLARMRLPFPEPIHEFVPLSTYYSFIPIFVGSISLVLFLNRQYVIPRAPSRIKQLYQVSAQVTLGSATAIALAVLILKESAVMANFPRVLVVWAWLLTIVLLVVVRLLLQGVRNGLRRGNVGRDRLLVVGTGEVARLTLQRIQWSPRLGYEVVGIINTNGGMRKLLGVPVIGTPEDLPTLIERHKIDEVIIAVPELGHRETVRIVSLCQRGRVSIKIFPDVFQFITSEATIDDLGGLPLLTVRDFAMRGYLLIFKRALDIAGSIAGLIVLSPLLLLGAIAIKLESSGPAFFLQERMGLDGKPFRIVKFRSMRQDAEKGGPGWTVQDDPRRTRLGTLLRKLDLDELPQLVNVLLGEMSLVGPRPEQPYYVAQFRGTVPDYMLRHQLRAGITGWAQVNGLRGDTSIAERTKYDLWYIENWSLLLDLTILARTVWQTVIGRNTGAG